MTLRNTALTLLAGSALVVPFAVPAGAQSCAEALQQVEQRTSQAGLGSQQQREVEQLLESARLFQRIEREQSCQNVLAEAERLLAQAGGSQQQAQTGGSGDEPLQRARQVLQSRQNQPTGQQAEGGAGAQSGGSSQQAQSDQQPSRQQQAQAAGQGGRDAVSEQQIQMGDMTPTIVVRQPPPRITIEIPEPRITVEMPEPEIIVQMPDPDVQVEQSGQPEVQVQMAEPEVEVRQGQPQLVIQRAGDQGTGQEQQQADQQRAQQAQQSDQEQAQQSDQEQAQQGDQQQAQQGDQEQAQQGDQQQAQQGDQQQAQQGDQQQGSTLVPATGGQGEQQTGERVGDDQDEPELVQGGVTPGEPRPAAQAAAGGAGTEAEQAASTAQQEQPGAGGGSRQDGEDQPAAVAAEEGRDEDRQAVSGGGSRADQQQPDDTRADQATAAGTATTGQGIEVRPATGGDQAAAQVEEQEMAARTTGDEAAKRLARQSPEELIGQEVRNRSGDTIAEIVDLVRQIADDQLFVVLSVGGFLGLGDKEVALPVDEFEVAASSDTLVLGDSSEERLESLPPYNHALYQSVVE